MRPTRRGPRCETIQDAPSRPSKQRDRLLLRDARVANDERCARRSPTREAVQRASPRRRGESFDFRVAAAPHTRAEFDGTCAVRLPPRVNRRDLAVSDRRRSACQKAAELGHTGPTKL